MLLYVQNEMGNDTCKTCPAGFYCLANSSEPIDCPVGSYCPSGTRFFDEFLCPAGTYSTLERLRSADECSPCVAGQYCATEGLTAPTGPCAEGYFCGSGSSVANPHASDPFHLGYVGDTCVVSMNTTVNDICPPGEKLVCASVPCVVSYIVYIVYIVYCIVHSIA